MAFPAPFLRSVVAPGVSVERQLAFGEDELRVGALLADIAGYFAIAWLAMWAGARRRWVGSRAVRGVRR